MRSFNNILGIPLFINLNKRNRLLFITDQLINFFFFVMLVKLANAFLATCNLYQFILSIKLQNLSTADFTCAVRFIYYHARYYQVFSKFFKEKRSK